ncbi:hypothetical protein VL22_0202975 [Escherichia fergusonii]|nr:hypothetical protein VL22_0202975 [Escherichia fergusonii]
MLISIRSILMDKHALRQLNPGNVQRAGSWIKHLSDPLASLCNYPGDRSPEFV